MSDNTVQRMYLEEFREALGSLNGSILMMAQIYVRAIDDDPRNADIFRDEFSESIPASAWSGFEAVGRKWMHPNLLMGGGGKYATKIKHLPYSTQERIFNGEKFELLVDSDDIQRGKVMADVRDITPEQVAQLIGDNHIRTLAEQRAWIESKKTSREIDAVPMPYTIKSGSVSFRRGTTLTRAEIKRLLQEM